MRDITEQAFNVQSESSDKKRRCVVIKIGSSTLTYDNGRVNYEFFESFAAQLSRIRAAGWSVVIVSSGAIACGLETLGVAERPSDMPTLQAAASVGQCALIQAYSYAFGHYDMTNSLVLLTRRETADREAYLYARDTLNRLLELDIIPIVNENDTVSVEQIRFGDNDTLGALVACLVNADLMIIGSDIDGFYSANPQVDPDATLIPEVTAVDRSLLASAGGAGSKAGSGGMITKVKAARVLMTAGIPLVVCNGSTPHIYEDIVNGANLGTRFVALEKSHDITPRKLWIALGDSARGSLVVDKGALDALLHRGASLLTVGIASVAGHFDVGDIIDVTDEDGYLIARGISSAPSDLLELAQGLTKEALLSNRLVASLADKPVIHRDDLVLFE